MKKSIVLSLVAVIVLVAAGGAFAWNGRGGRNMAPTSTEFSTMERNALAWRMQGRQGSAQWMPSCGMDGRMMGAMRGGARGRMSVWANVEFPQEIQDKQAEIQKLTIDMRNEMQKNPIDRAKIETLYAKRVELRNELSGWRMTQRLDMIQKLQK